MTTIIKRVYKFNCAHHLNDGSKCENLHGHNYVLTVFVKQPSFTPSRAIIIPFDELDCIVDPLIGNLDHKNLVGNTNIERGDVMWKHATNQCVHIDTDVVSTERLAEWIADVLDGAISIWNDDVGAHMGAIQLYKVELWETDRNGAEVYVNEPQ